MTNIIKASKSKNSQELKDFYLAVYIISTCTPIKSTNLHV